jgi:hypothetical protein
MKYKLHSLCETWMTSQDSSGLMAVSMKVAAFWDIALRLQGTISSKAVVFMDELHLKNSCSVSLLHLTDCNEMH